MKKIFIYTLLFCFILTVSAFANLENKKIIPGESVGGIKIGSKTTDLIAKIGNPDKEQAVAGSPGQANLIYNYDKDAEKEYGLIFTEENGIIISIKSEGPNGFETPGGVKVGSKMKDAEDEFADQIEQGYWIFDEDPSTDWKTVFFPRAGISFMGKFDAGKGDVIITVIMVFEPYPNWEPQ